MSTQRVLAIFCVSLMVLSASSVGVTVGTEGPPTPVVENNGQYSQEYSVQSESQDLTNSTENHTTNASSINEQAIESTSATSSEVRPTVEGIVTDELDTGYRKLHEDGLNASWWTQQSIGQANTVVANMADALNPVPTSAHDALIELGGQAAPHAKLALTYTKILANIGILASSVDTAQVGANMDTPESYDTIRTKMDKIRDNANAIDQASTQEDRERLFRERRQLIEELYVLLPNYLNSVHNNILANPVYDFNLVSFAGASWNLGRSAYSSIRWNGEVLRHNLLLDYRVTTMWLQNDTSGESLVTQTGQEMPRHRLDYSSQWTRIYDTIDTGNDYAVYKIEVSDELAGSNKNLRVRIGTTDPKNFSAYISESKPSSIGDPSGVAFEETRTDVRHTESGVSSGSYYVVVKTTNDSSLFYKLETSVYKPHWIPLIDIEHQAPPTSVVETGASGDGGSGSSGASETTVPDPEIKVSTVPRRYAKAGDEVRATVEVTNRGDTSDWQSIALSIPRGATAENVEVFGEQTTLSRFQEFPAGSEVGAAYGTETRTTEYLLIEGSKHDWGSERHRLVVNITPQASGKLPLYSKSVARHNGSWVSEPDIGGTTTVDQQSEYVHKETVAILSDEEWSAMGKNWSTAQFDEVNTRYNPAARGPRENLLPHWSFKTGHPQLPGTFHAAPALVNGTLYVGSDDGHVRALDLETGDQKWGFDTRASVQTTPAVVDGVVYVGNAAGELFALDAETGTKIWERGWITNGGFTAPTVVNDTIYVGNQDGNLYAVSTRKAPDERGDALKWTFTTGGTLSGPPAVADGRVYVVKQNKRVYALNATGGEVRWSQKVRGDGDETIRGGATVVNGIVYLGVRDRDNKEGVTAFRASDGTNLWRTYMGDVTTGLAFRDGVIFAATQQNTIYGLDATDGTILRSFETDGTPTAPTIAGDTLFVGTNKGTVYALGADRLSERARFGSDTSITASPIAANQLLVVGTEGGEIHALGEDTPPNVEFSVTPSPISVGESITFNGSASTASSEITAYEWDFDDDGQFDTSGETVTHTFEDPGEYRATLRIRTADGEVATGVQSLTVDADLGDWPMAQADRLNLGYESTHGPSSDLISQWTIGHPRVTGTFHAAPALVNGTLYVGSDDGYIRAVDFETGDQKWKFDTGASVRTTPAVVDGVVYVGNAAGDLFALNAETGAKIWKRGWITNGGFTAPTVINDTIYVGSRDGNLYAVSTHKTPDRREEALKWTFTTGGTLSGPPAVADGQVYVVKQNKRVYALNETSGEVRWSQKVRGDGDETIRGGATVINGIVYLGVRDRDNKEGVTAFRASDGTNLWRTYMGDVTTGLAFRDGVIFAATQQNTIYGLDATDGTILRSFETDGTPTAPTVAGDTLFVGTNKGTVYALGADGLSERARFRSDTRIATSPIVANQLLVVGTEGGEIHALGEKDPPSVEFSVTPSLVSVGESITFNGSASTASSEITAYEWDFDDDGQFETSGKSVTHTFDALGEYRATLRIRTADGEVATGVQSLTVDASPGDWATAQADRLNLGYESTYGPSTGLVQQWVTGHPKVTGAFHAAPALVNGTLYVGSDDGYIRAVDFETGDRKWMYNTGASVRTTPAVVDGVVYVGNTAGELFALDAETGTKIWERGWITNGGFTAPTVVNDTIYVGNQDGNLYAVTTRKTPDRREEALKWMFTTGGTLSGPPAVADGRVYVVKQNRRLYALNATGGKVRWSRKVRGDGDETIRGGATVVNDIVYLGVRDRDNKEGVTAFRASDGDQLWQTYMGDVTTGLAFRDGAIFAATQQNTIYGLDATDGTILRSFETDGTPTGPTIAGDTLFVGTSKGTVYALGADGLSERARFRSDTSISAPPIAAEKLLIVGSKSGRIRALGEKDPPSVEFSVTPSLVSVGESVSFNGSVSTASSEITAYEWDFDDDGQFDTSGETVTHTFEDPGGYRVTLRIRTADGEVATGVQSLTVGASPGDWKMAQADRLNLGYEPAVTALTNLSTNWSNEIGIGNSGVAVHDNMIYAGSQGGHVYALDITSGNITWAFDTGASVQTTPAVVDEVVYVGNAAGDLFALDAETGTKIWERSWITNGGFTAPTVVNETIYVGNQDGNLYAVSTRKAPDERGDALKWTFTTGGTLSGPPAVADGRVYVVKQNRRVYALNATSGEVRWSQKVRGDGDETIRGGATVVNDIVYLGVRDRDNKEGVTAFRASDGTNLWRTYMGDVTTGLAFRDGVIFAATQQNTIYGLDATHGKILRSFETDGTPTAPTIAGDTLFVGTNKGTVYALNANGLSERDNTTIPGSVSGAPVPVRNALFVGSGSGQLHALGDTDTAQISVNREIDEAVDPGGVLNVTVHVEINQSIISPGVDERLPTGFNIISHDSTPSAVYRDSRNQWLWRQADAGSSLSISYQIAIPEDVSRGNTYQLVGEISTANQTPMRISGDQTILIAKCAPNVVAGDDSIIGLQEIQQGLLWWATNTPVPRTGEETFSLPEIQRLIHAWSQDQTVGCGTLDDGDETSSTTSSLSETATTASNDVVRVEQRPASVRSSHGENATLSIIVNASGYDAPGVDLSLPSNWSVVDYQATNATYRASENQWVWLTGGNRTLEYTVAIPENGTSSGNHTISAEVSAIDPETGDRVTVTEVATVRIGEATTCVADAVSGSDSRISLPEIQTAINWWAEDTEVPETGGQTISLSQIQSLINAWAEDKPVGC